MTKLIFLLFVSFSAFGQEKIPAGDDPPRDIISDNYEAGPYLIYDCVEKHWTCVKEPYYKECQEKRARDHKKPNNVYHSCAPIGLFPTKKSCFQRQLFMISQNHGTRVCVKEEWKEKAVP